MIMTDAIAVEDSSVSGFRIFKPGWGGKYLISSDPQHEKINKDRNEQSL